MAPEGWQGRSGGDIILVQYVYCGALHVPSPPIVNIRVVTIIHIKRCLHYHTCMPYMYALHVPSPPIVNIWVVTIIHIKRCLHYHTCMPYTCAMNVYTVAHVCRACATNRYTSHMHDVHVRRTCLHYHTCTAYMYGVPVRRTCMIV